MAFYIRKISRSKWEKGSQTDPDADAITGCTRTTLNTLSLWLVDNDTAAEIDKAFLALASSMEKAEGFEVLVIEQSTIDSVFTVEKTEMDSPFKEMNNNHFDISGLKYSTLKDVADLIITGINNQKTIKKTKTYIKSLIETAIDESKINKNDLNDYLKNNMWPAEFPKP